MTNRKHGRAAVMAVVVVVALGGSAAASQPHPQARAEAAQLSGFQEVPALSTTGEGTFRARVSADGTSIRYRLEYGDLTSTVNQAHIHFGQSGVNGGVSAFLCTNLGNGPTGTQACPEAGTVTGTIVAADVVGPAAQGIAAGELEELVSAIHAGAAYANVHTATFPGGEVRGQLGHGAHDHDSH